MIDFRLGITEAMGMFVGRLWLLVLLALLYLVVLEWRTFASAIASWKHGTRLPPTAWKGVRFRLRYFWGGLLLVLLSYVIVQGTLMLFGDAVLPRFPYVREFRDVHTFLDFLNYLVGYKTLFTIGGLMASGFLLMFSMGGRWMVNLVKLLVTVTLAFFCFMIFYIITLNSGLLGA